MKVSADQIVMHLRKVQNDKRVDFHARGYAELGADKIKELTNALSEIEEIAADRADVDDGVPDAWMRALVIAREALDCAISSPNRVK